MKNNNHYFSHDGNAHQDIKCMELVMQYGWEGYGVYRRIVEHLFGCQGYKERLSKRQAIAYQMQIDASKFSELFDFMVSAGLLKVDVAGDYFYSESLLRRMQIRDEIVEKRKEAGRRGGLASQSKGQAVVKQSSSNKIKLNKSKGNNTKENIDSNSSKDDKEVGIDKEGEEEKDNALLLLKKGIRFSDMVFTEQNNQKYGEVMLKEFYDYRTMKDGKNKRRIEYEKFFYVSKRLATWFRKSQEFEKPGQFTHEQKPKMTKEQLEAWKRQNAKERGRDIYDDTPDLPSTQPTNVGTFRNYAQRQGREG